jgi:hypothetical protein
MARWKFGFAITLLLALAVCAWFWLKAPYAFSEANRVAEKFVALLQSGDTQSAYELTLKNSLVGTTQLEFKTISDRQLCGSRLQRVGQFPLQTNGNRLRRWLKGAEIDMPEIQIEFEGFCLFSVSLRHLGNGQWMVHNFQRHAG